MCPGPRSTRRQHWALNGQLQSSRASISLPLSGHSQRWNSGHAVQGRRQLKTERQVTARERLVPALAFSAIGVACIISMMAIPSAFFFALWAILAFPVLWLALFVYAARKGGAGSAAAMIFIPLAVFTMSLAPKPGASASRWVADLLDVAAFRGDLLRQMNRQQGHATDQHIAVVYLAGFGSLTNGLAYDPSRGLDNPSRITDPLWRSEFESTELSLSNADIRHVVGPYYAWFHP